MSGLDDFKAKYPQYKDLPDPVLADKLYSKYYTDMPRNVFDKKMGVPLNVDANIAAGGAPPPAAAPVPKPAPAAKPPASDLLPDTYKGMGEDISGRGRAALGQLKTAATAPPSTVDMLIHGASGLPGAALLSPQLLKEATALVNYAGAAPAGAIAGTIGQPLVRGYNWANKNLFGGKLPQGGQKAVDYIGDVGSMLLPLGMKGKAPTRVEAPAEFEPPAAPKPEAAPIRAKKGGAVAEPITPAPEPVRAAPPERAPVTAPEPKAGPILESKRPGEKPVDTGRRWDDAANRLQTNDDASKMEARTWVNKLPPELKQPQIWEKLHNEIEQKLVDPNAKLSPEAERAYQAVKPWDERANKAASWIKAHGVTDAELPDMPSGEQGYARRVVKGKGHVLDAMDPEAQWERDPIMSTAPGSKSLSRYAPSLKQRQFFVLQDKVGNRTLLPADSELKLGAKTSQGEVKMATTQEIEANTGTVYHKNYAVNTIDNALRLERVQRNMQVLDGITKEMNDKGLMWKEKWPIETLPDGTIRYARNQRPRPEGYVETKIPQLRDHYFPKETADTLNDIFRGEEHGPFLDGLSRVNRVLNGSLFWNPIPHQMNVAADFVQNRGWDWVNPVAYKRLMVNGTRAFNAIRTRNADYVNFMREGAGLHLPAIENKNFYEGLLTKFGEEVRQDPGKWDEMARSVGLGKGADLANAVTRMVKAEYGLSSKAMWVVDDFLKMTRYLENMDKGMGAREAIALAEKDMASYRVPPTVAGSRGFAQFFKSPIFQSFGRYHFSKLRSIGLIMRDLVKGTRQEKIDASGKLAVMGAMLYLLKPLMDAGVQKLTGEKKAQFGMPGAMGLAGRGLDLAGRAIGSKDMTISKDPDDYAWQRFFSSFLNPSPAISTPLEVIGNKDFSGRNIVEPESSRLGQATQAGEYVAGKFGPAATAVGMAKPGGTKKELARQVDINIPTPTKAKYQKIPRTQAKSRERKDSIEGWIRRMTQ